MIPFRIIHRLGPGPRAWQSLGEPTFAGTVRPVFFFSSSSLLLLLLLHPTSQDDVFSPWLNYLGPSLHHMLFCPRQSSTTSAMNVKPIPSFRFESLFSIFTLCTFLSSVVSVLSSQESTCSRSLQCKPSLPLLEFRLEVPLVYLVLFLLRSRPSWMRCGFV